MSRIYAISAHVVRKVTEGSAVSTVSQQVPTFYLFADVQGITSEDHASRIARDMISRLTGPDVEVFVSACETSMNAHKSTDGAAIGETVSGVEHVDRRPVSGIVERVSAMGLYIRTSDGRSVYLDSGDGWTVEPSNDSRPPTSTCFTRAD